MKSVLKLIMNLRERNKHIKITVMIDKIIAVWVIIPCLLRIIVQILTTDINTLKTALDEENNFYQKWFMLGSTHPYRLSCDLFIYVVIMLFIELILRTKLKTYAYVIPISGFMQYVILISMAMLLYLILFRVNEVNEWKNIK